MNEQQARAIVGILVAAYPREAIERTTEDLYTKQLARLDSPETAHATVQFIIDHHPTFPTLADFRREYLAHRKKQAEADAYHRGLDEPAAGPVPDWVIDYARNLGDTPLEPNAIDSLTERDPGRCDDCGQHSNDGGIHGPRYQYGRFTICRPCALSRLKAASGLGIGAPA